MATVEEISPRAVRLVKRALLTEQLSATPPGGVTLVCAPAGSGKTMLLRSWAAELGDPIASITVERRERDAQRFWLNLIEAFADATGDDLVERVSPAPSFAGAAVVKRLASQLELAGKPLVLVIDDLHELESADALAWLELLLCRLPVTLRVVLATREEPTLGLHRLRLTGQLTELRGPDLRFSVDETCALLGAGGISMTNAAVAALHDRTEGWAAGLRLAAISLAGHPDPERFVAEFSGSERTVAGYLVAEVLERQPPEVRELLLRTALLERVSGPLADALTGGTGAEAILQRLEDQNAFVSALDARRTWFRYHRLFADLLQLELRRVTPAIIPALHRAAAAWHEQHGDVVEAIRHAQEARDWAHASRLLVDNHFALNIAGRRETIDVLLAAFPPDAYREDANLAVTLAINRTLLGLLDEARAYLDVARQLATTATADRRHLVEVYVATVGLELGRRGGDLAEAEESMNALEHALEGMAVAHERPAGPEYRALALMNLGIAELWSVRPDDARRHLEAALELTREIPLPFVEIGCLAHLAIAAPLTGLPLPLALDLSEGALAIAEPHGWADEPITTPAFAISGMTLVRLGRFADAERRLERAERVLAARGDPASEVVLHHGRGLLLFGTGRLEEALVAFARAQSLERVLARRQMYMIELQSRALQVQIRMGETERARLALRDLEPRDRERAGMRIAAAALALAEEQPDQALEELAPVIAGSTEAIHERWMRVEALLLDAAARDRLQDRRSAEDALERALELAEPEGLLLPFMLWPVRELLERHPRHRSTHATLVATILDLHTGSAPRQLTGPIPGADELSDAELRVVRYLPSNLSAPEIAAELFVSANTVRTHMRHIYLKLDAHNRSDAVTRARELGLLAPGPARH